MKRLIWGLSVILIAILSFVIGSPVNAAANDHVVDAKAALIADAATGQVIYQQNSNQKLPVASISKLLTACVIEDEIQHHQLHWNDKITFNKQLADISNDKNYSALGLQKGESYTVKDLYNAMLIKSADGAALALATAHGQTMAQFNQKMRTKAKQIGLKDYQIVNPVGLNNEDTKAFQLKQYSNKAQNSMTACDVALLAQYLLKHYPNVVQTTGQVQSQIRVKGQVKTYRNMNKMLVGQPMAMKDIPIDGLKTGTSDEAGACFVSSGQYQGHQIITVVLNAHGKGDARFTATQQLYRYLQSNYHLQSLKLKQSDQRVRVSNGRQRFAKVTPVTIQVWANKPLSHYTVTTHYQKPLVKGKGVKAPLRKNQQIGLIKVKALQLTTLNNQPWSTPLYAKQADPVGNFWQRLIN